MDDTAFERLVAECENALKRFLYYKLPCKADGDDILQETLLAAYRNRGAIKNTESFKPWLLRIASNKCNDFYRRRAKNPELPMDGIPESVLSYGRSGPAVTQSVLETLGELGVRDTQILRMFYIEDLPQTEIAGMLGIPEGTVKSRLYAARQRFKSVYPFPPETKGERKMSKLPEILPEYTIAKSEKPIFPVKWEEMMGWFIVPRPGEKLSWAMYDFPERKRTELYESEVTGFASVHGIDGVEITVQERRGGEHEGRPESRNLTRTFVAQLTGAHCRILAESHYDGDIKRFFTFLDGDDFIPNWGFGEDNCGNEVNLRQKGIIQRKGNKIKTEALPFLLDAVGRYTVSICGKQYDCVCVIDVNTYNPGIVSEQFIDENGRTVLWRRYNHDEWALNRYKQKWSEKLPGNERLDVDGGLYVHWYDCITDYIL